MDANEVSSVHEACTHSKLIVPVPDQVNKAYGAIVSEFRIQCDGDGHELVSHVMHGNSLFLKYPAFPAVGGAG